MSAKKINKYILVVDCVLPSIDEWKKEAESSEVPFLFAHSGKEGQRLLADKKIEFAGFFLNPNISNLENDPGCLSIARFARQQRAGLPFFIIYDEELPENEEKLKNLGVKEFLKKPVSVNDMLVKLEAPVIKLAEAPTKKIEENPSVEDEEYVQIRANSFVSGSICTFDVYVRLPAGRFIKLLSNGDSFSAERIQEYLNKGVEYFYLKKEDQEAYVEFYNKVTENVAKSKNASMDTKLKSTLSFGQETLNFMREGGISETNLEYATTFVENVHNLVGKMNVTKGGQFDKFIKNLETYEHGVSVSMIASLLSNVSGIESAGLVQIVGMAAMFHDIGMASMSLAIQTEDESKMTDEEKVKFRMHPQLGADLLMKVPGTHPTVIQAVLQHHERRGEGKGFGSVKKPKLINRVAEIVGIADEYLRVMIKYKNASPEEIIDVLNEEVLPGFNQPIVEAFRSVYMK